MNDYIEIIDDDGNEESYELISTFRLEGYPSNYILYKEMEGSKYYVAKYSGEDISSLDTNLSDEEIALAKSLFGGVDN